MFLPQFKKNSFHQLFKLSTSVCKESDHLDPFHISQSCLPTAPFVAPNPAVITFLDATNPRQPSLSPILASWYWLSLFLNLNDLWFLLHGGTGEVFQLLSRGDFLQLFFSRLGDGESLQGAEPLMFVDHPVNILTWVIKFFCSALFSRLFVMHLRKRENAWERKT